MQKPVFLFCLLWIAPGAEMAAQSLFDSLRAVGRVEVYFAFAKQELSADAHAALDSFVALYNRQSPPCHVRITAHTDSVGNWSSNLALSQRRAQAVQAALEARGLPPENIELRYFGEQRPATQNSTEAGRQQNRRATVEVFRAIPMAPYAGRVKDQKTGNGIATTVHFSTTTLRDSVQTDTSGVFSVRLPVDSVVKTEVYARGYFFDSQIQRIFGTPAMLRRMRARPIELVLAPAKAGEKAVLSNLFFAGNEARLLKSSTPELPKVLKFMQINPELQVEIAGHINHPGLAPEKLQDWEWLLSKNRAKVVYDYLVHHGIPASRMQYKGYGNTEMLFPNYGATEAQMEQNRRVEIRVIQD